MNHIIKQVPERHEFVQFATLTFRQGLQHSPSTPPLAFTHVSAQLQAVPGVKAIYLGQQMERPDHWTWAVCWASPAALDAYLASPIFDDWLDDFRATTDSYIFTKSLLRGDAAAALNAPCTEIFTAYGAPRSFLETRVKPLASRLSAGAVPGVRASAFGQFELLAEYGVLALAGITVSVIIGWDTYEAQRAQTDQEKLSNSSVHYARDDIKSVDLVIAPFPGTIVASLHPGITLANLAGLIPSIMSS
ncbi:hypothetical protein DCS_07531 [Drechmeria coniospora]|uniref:ABM domain-containing protein n=1 Tax=Drechmeria coniospora TaxID=98403 RepID=A0A151GEQ4_DRECN|nr:hypothetical protein DCS_07531 [Drechmeria coniospora]KYK55568.1 hypothetical protein DCS_07531 [Drechmeria coniospora]